MTTPTGPAAAQPAPGTHVHVQGGKLLHNRKAQLAAVGLAVVAVLVWRKRSGGTTANNGGLTSLTPSGGSTAPTGGYDSTASDVYNGIQPEIDALNATLGGLQNQLAGTGASGSGGSTQTYQGNAYLVSDLADENVALADGIPLSALRFAGQDPYAGRGGDYEAPTNLSTWDASQGGTPIYVGLAGQIAPSGATKAQGATRVQTDQILKQLLAGQQSMPTSPVTAPVTSPAMPIVVGRLPGPVSGKYQPLVK